MARPGPKAVADATMMAAIAVSAAAVGALYGYVSFPETPLFSLARGAVTGVAISVLITGFELVLTSAAMQPVRHLPFGLLLALRTAVYTALIVAGYEFGRIVALAPGESLLVFDAFFWRTLWISLAVSFVVNTGLEVTRLLGGGVLWGLLLARYMRPRLEERVVLFVDLKDSTRHAGRLGDLAFHSLLNRFFQDVSHAVLMTGGAIYKYNGDAAIVVWKPRTGLRRANALRCVIELRRQIERRADLYSREFGLVPQFRAGLHLGPVVIGELGDLRQEIAYSGDAMNTAARIEQATRELGRDILVSAALARRLPPEAGIPLVPVGSVELAGKPEKLELLTIGGGS
mgnify:CR=1 FL=1